MLKKSIIWNLTCRCSWNCKFCCMDAKYIGAKKVNVNKDFNFHFPNELSFQDKLKVIDNIDIPVRIDFSGGELLLDPLNTELMLYASKKIGKDNIGISTSGIFIDQDWISKIRPYINDVELTLDKVPYIPYEHRPIGYHEYAANAIHLLRKNNIFTGVQTVLTSDNSDLKSLMQLHSWIEENDVNEWSILKFFETGRGKQFRHLQLQKDEYEKLASKLKSFKSKTKIHLQYLLSDIEEENTCRAVKKSLGILPNGNCISCFWALNENTIPLNNNFILGNLASTKLSTLLNGEVAKYWQNIKKCIL